MLLPLQQRGRAHHRHGSFEEFLDDAGLVGLVHQGEDPARAHEGVHRQGEAITRNVRDGREDPGLPNLAPRGLVEEHDADDVLRVEVRGGIVERQMAALADADDAEDRIQFVVELRVAGELSGSQSSTDGESR